MTAILYIGHGRLADRLDAHRRDLENKPRISSVAYTSIVGKYRTEQMERVELGTYAYRYGKLPRYNGEDG